MRNPARESWSSSPARRLSAESGHLSSFHEVVQTQDELLQADVQCVGG